MQKSTGKEPTLSCLPSHFAALIEFVPLSVQYIVSVVSSKSTDIVLTVLLRGITTSDWSGVPRVILLTSDRVVNSKNDSMSEV